MRGIGTEFNRQYKDIPENKICSRGVFGGFCHDTNTSILKLSFVSPITSEKFHLFWYVRTTVG